MTMQAGLIFGPVPSRRLGLSLGVDIVPRKVCTLDCIYCEVGRTTLKTIDRKPYVPIESLLAELRERLSCLAKVDYITITGSGEPTLNSDLGLLIDRIKQAYSIPVALITNGTLLYRPDVRAESAKADLVMPSLDAVDVAAYERINRPHPEITVERIIQGLEAFRREYAGPIWLEVLLVEGINAEPNHIDLIRQTLIRIRPDKVQLNTAIRPTADQDVRRVSTEKLRAVAELLGPCCEVIADFRGSSSPPSAQIRAGDVLALLRRRPCTLEDLISALGISRGQAAQYTDSLLHQGLITSDLRNGTAYYQDITLAGS